MTRPHSVVVVGGGLAAAKTAEALRGQGYAGPVTVIGAERHLPYERPPLSKSYLAGKSEFDEAVVLGEQWYRDNNVELRTGTRVTGIDPAAHTVTLDDGTTLDYGAAVLATGSIPRRLDAPGGDSDGLLTLRTREDADAIAATFGAGRRLVIIGAGWIGLEVAAAARDAGTDVTVIEVAELPLLHVVGPEVARVFADLHVAHGVDLRLGTHLDSIRTADGRATGVRFADGTTLDGDAIVVGVGVTPDVAIAQAAGLAVHNGVLVDAQLRTSGADVYAVGDIANHDHPLLGRIRVEHWANALNQPAAAVAALLGGDQPYRNLPYFYSDQYDLGMEYVGHAGRGTYAQVVVRGDLAAREFVAFWLDESNRVLAAMNVNVWDVPDAVKPLIASRQPVDPARLTDSSIPIADLAG